MSDIPTLYGGPATRRVRTRDLQAAKLRGDRWPMLTAYDQYTAAIFDEAGVPVLLVGDSAANNVFGYETTLPVTVDELLPLVRAVVRATKRALIVADLPFGSLRGRARPGAAHRRPVHEGGRRARGQARGRAPRRRRRSRRWSAPASRSWRTSVSPRRANTRSAATACRAAATRATQLLADARAVAEAGAFAVVLEMVPGEVAEAITKELRIPTIGIGAGPGLRRPGAGLAGHGRAAHRQGAALRQAVRQPGRHPHRSRPRIRRRGPRRRVPGHRTHLLEPRDTR